MNFLKAIFMQKLDMLKFDINQKIDSDMAKMKSRD
jgi:hypothetical protein